MNLNIAIYHSNIFVIGSERKNMELEHFLPCMTQAHAVEEPQLYEGRVR